VIKRHRFYPAVMFSQARLTYTEVAAALYEKDAAVRRKLEPLLPHLETLDEVFRILLVARGKRGAIDFDTAETSMVFDDHGKIQRIEPYERNDAHRLIEECMLAANVCASAFLHEQEQAVLYRIHPEPKPEKVAKLRDFLGTFGLQLGGGESPTAKDYAKLLERIQDRPDKALLQTVMLRSLQQAIYSPDNVGHFGLAYESYTHFTSPIRRYPDLLVHRAIKAASPASVTSLATGPTSACTARPPSAAPTRPRVTSSRGSSATTCRTGWARCSPAAFHRWCRSVSSSPLMMCSSRGWCMFPISAGTISISTSLAM
jgi:ribonuclease R